MAHTEPSLSQHLIDSAAVAFAVACSFITDPEGRVLIVNPHYRDDWLFVGGGVDKGETPNEGCAREVKEEIGLDRTVGDLLVVDWVPLPDNLDMPIAFYLFDGGVITDPDSIHLQAEELDEFKFLPPDKAVSLLADFNKPRVEMAIEARRTGKTVYQPMYG